MISCDISCRFLLCTGGQHCVAGYTDTSSIHYTYFKEPWNTFRCALHTVAPAITRSHNCFKQPLGFMAKPQETWLTLLKQNDCPCAYRGMMLHMSCLFFGSDIDFTPIPSSVGVQRGVQALCFGAGPFEAERQRAANFFGGSVQIITRYYIHDFSNSGIYRKYLTWWGPTVCAGDYCLMCWCYKDERNQQDEDKEERTKTWQNTGIHHLAILPSQLLNPGRGTNYHTAICCRK